jgi:2TM domain
MSDDFSAKKLNKNNEPNPWSVSETQPKYQPPPAYTTGQTQSNPTPGVGFKDFNLPQSTYNPIYPIPPMENTPGNQPVSFNPYPYGSPMSEQEAYRRASKRVKEKMDFYNNLRSYVTTIIVLWGIWFAIALVSGSRQAIWPIWVTIFWGIGVALHSFNVFGWPKKLDFMNEKDRDRLIEEELRRMKR